MNGLLINLPAVNLFDGKKQMRQRLLFIPVILLLLVPVFAQQATDPSLITVDSIFARARSLGPVRWQKNGSGYLALEPSVNNRAIVEIVRYDAATGERTILVSSEKLKPASATTPLEV